MAGNPRLLKDPATANSRVFIGHLQTDDLNKNELEDHFSKYGTIIGSSINRGFGFIQFENEQSAMDAINSENGSNFKGRRIDVKPANKKEGGPGGGPGGGGGFGGNNESFNNFGFGGGNQNFGNSHGSFGNNDNQFNRGGNQNNQFNNDQNPDDLDSRNMNDNNSPFGGNRMGGSGMGGSGMGGSGMGGSGMGGSGMGGPGMGGGGMGGPGGMQNRNQNKPNQGGQRPPRGGARGGKNRRDNSGNMRGDYDGMDMDDMDSGMGGPMDRGFGGGMGRGLDRGMGGGLDRGMGGGMNRGGGLDRDMGRGMSGMDRGMGPGGMDRGMGPGGMDRGMGLGGMGSSLGSGLGSGLGSKLTGGGLGSSLGRDMSAISGGLGSSLASGMNNSIGGSMGGGLGRGLGDNAGGNNFRDRSPLGRSGRMDDKPLANWELNKSGNMRGGFGDHGGPGPGSGGAHRSRFDDFKSSQTAPKDAGPGFGSQPAPTDYPSFAAEKNDCEIIVVNKSLTEYAEIIEARLKKLGLTVDLLFPNEDVPLSRVLGNIASRGCLYAIVITPTNKEHRSLTLNILHGLPQEHRNMPVDDAITLVMRDFKNYKSGGRSVPAKAQPAADRHPDAIQVLLNMLADNLQLTVLQYDRVLKYLDVRREEQVQFELGEDAKDIGPLAVNDPKQAELQSRILNILNSNKGGPNPPNSGPMVGAAPSPVPPPAATVSGPSSVPPSNTVTPSPLLNDPTVQKALDSLIQGNLLKNIGDQPPPTSTAAPLFAAFPNMNRFN